MAGASNADEERHTLRAEVTRDATVVDEHAEAAKSLGFSAVDEAESHKEGEGDETN